MPRLLMRPKGFLQLQESKISERSATIKPLAILNILKGKVRVVTSAPRVHMRSFRFKVPQFKQSSHVPRYAA